MRRSPGCVAQVVGWGCRTRKTVRQWAAHHTVPSSVRIAKGRDRICRACLERHTTAAYPAPVAPGHPRHGKRGRRARIARSDDVDGCGAVPNSVSQPQHQCPRKEEGFRSSTPNRDTDRDPLRDIATQPRKPDGRTGNGQICAQLHILTARSKRQTPRRTVQDVSRQWVRHAQPDDVRAQKDQVHDHHATCQRGQGVGEDEAGDDCMAVTSKTGHTADVVDPRGRGRTRRGTRADLDEAIPPRLRSL